MNQKGGSRTETLVKLVLIFVISLLSFSVGTFVGKQFSDSQHKMANLEDEFHGNRGTASDDRAEDREHALTDADIASLTEEFVNAEKESIDHEGEHDDHMPSEAHKEEASHHSKKEETSHDSHHSQEVVKAEKAEAHGHEKDAVANAAERVAKDLAPGKNPPVQSRKVSSLPSVLSSTVDNHVNKYTIQVASYSTEKEAREHTQKLKDSGLNAFFIPAQVKGNTWYRVSVGIYTSHKEASDYKDKLMKQAKLNSAIVQKIVSQ